MIGTPQADAPRRRVVGAAFLSQIATLLPFVFGLATASIIATKAPKYVDPAAPDFVGGLLAISPSWFFLPVCLLALIGGTALEIVPGTGDAVVTCDGRRTVRVPHGARVEVAVGRTPVQLARLHPQSFTDRLVGKFDLPVDGWRGSSRNVGRLP